MRIKLMLCFLVVMMIRCSNKSSNPVNPPPPPLNEMTASVSINGGASISNTASGANTTYATSNDASGNLIIDITANLQQGKMILKLVNINTPGTYTINNGGTKYVLDTFVVGSDKFIVPAPPPISGKLTVEECDAFKIKGNFYMTCTGPAGSVEFKNGTFYGKY